MRFSLTHFVFPVLVAGIGGGCGQHSSPSTSPEPMHVALSELHPSSTSSSTDSSLVGQGDQVITLAMWDSTATAGDAQPTAPPDNGELKFPNQKSANTTGAETGPDAANLAVTQPTSATPQSNQPQASSNPTTSKQEGEKFQPPFQQRTDLFAPPQLGTSAPIGEEENSSVSTHSVSDVSLKGFARVNDACVILMIEETITPLRAGQEKQGIRVLEISPPQVTLESASRRWTLTLSNQIGEQARQSVRRPSGD